MILDAAKKQEVELKTHFNDSWSDEESVMDRVLQEDVKKELPSMNKSWQQQNKDGRLMDDILDVKTTTSPKKSKKFKNASFFKIKFGFVFILFDSSETINYLNI